MDENARRIFDEAFATLERTANIEVRQRDDSKPDALEEWRRGMPPKPAPPPPLTTADVERRISDALPGVATIVHEIRQQLRKEFADEIAKLRSEFDLRLSALLQAKSAMPT